MAGMRQEKGLLLEAALREVPQGSIAVEYRGGADKGVPVQPALFRAETDGRGKLEVYSIFSGITAVFQSYLAGQVEVHHNKSPQVLEIDHCCLGRIGWNMGGDETVYLGENDLVLHSMDCCADSVMLFPLGCYMALAFSVDLEQLAACCPSILREAGFAPKAMQKRFCCGHPVAMPPSLELEGIFAPLYGLPEKLRLPYLKLKVQELLLYLSRMEASGYELARYVSQQTERVREIHALMTEHLDQRYTIEELSRRYLINTSSLKEVFKAVYGLPIATYMKEFRVRRAMELLRESDASIADVAAQVGYETQGKFTKAFKDVAHQLPTAFRKQHRPVNG